MNRQDVKDLIKEFMDQGYNKNQATSLAWAEFFEEKMAIIEARYQGNFDAGYEFHCNCFDCKTSNVFRAADTIRLFINEHKGHNTKTLKVS